MKRIATIFLLIITLFPLVQAQSETIYSGKVEADRREWKHLPLFSAFKGDKIKFEAKAHHKRRTIHLSIAQHPGNSVVYYNLDVAEDAHEFLVPDNAVYCIWYEGPNIEATLNVERIPGPNAGGELPSWKIVSTPDTTHNSEFREVEIGKKVRLKAMKKKVKVNQFETTEIVSNVSFASAPTTSDMYFVEVRSGSEDDYMTKYLTGLKVSLVVGEEAYEALQGVVSDGLTAGVGKLASMGKNKAKNKLSKKKDPAKNYEFVDDIEGEQEKMEKASEILELSSEAATIAGEDTEDEEEADLASDGLAMAGHIIAEGGLKKVIVKEGLKEAGLGNLSVEGLTGYDVPSLGDMADGAAAAITPKIKDKVSVKLKDLDTEQIVLDKTAGFFAEELPLDSTQYKFYHVIIENPRELKDAKNLLSYMVFGNLILEAKYRITEYADMVYFEPEEEPVKTKKFFKEFEENQEVRIVLDHQVKPWDTLLTLEEAELSRPLIYGTSKL
jgi:hypothetical protein